LLERGLFNSGVLQQPAKGFHGAGGEVFSQQRAPNFYVIEFDLDEPRRFAISGANGNVTIDPLPNGRVLPTELSEKFLGGMSPHRDVNPTTLETVDVHKSSSAVDYIADKVVTKPDNDYWKSIDTSLQARHKQHLV
jgi:hypothetical protein